MRCNTQREGQGQGQGEGVSPTPSCKPKLRKGLWSPDEDNKLTNYIMRNGLIGCWSYIAEQAGLQRCGKSCRLRWINYLRPGIKRGAISRQEEKQIIYLQSILGNRWSQIAAHLRGRTDNEIKNYWNSCIKKKLKLKHHLYFSSSTANGRDTMNTKCKLCNIPSQSQSICNTSSVFAYAQDGCTSSYTVMAEGYHPPNNTNQFTSIPGILELEHERGRNQNHKIPIDKDLDPTKSHLISYSHLGIHDSTSPLIHDSVSTHAFICPILQAQEGHNNDEAAKSTWKEIDSWTASTLPLQAEAGSVYYFPDDIITVPGLIGSELMKENFENNIDNEICNQNEIMSLLTTSSGIGSTAWNAGHSYSNIATADCSQVSQFGERPGWQFNDFLFDDDYQGLLNLGYDIDLGISTYIDINNNSHKSYQLPHGERKVADQRGCSTTPNEEEISNPFPAILGGGGGPLEIECEGGGSHVTVWAHDNICNSNTIAATNLDQI